MADMIRKMGKVILCILLAAVPVKAEETPATDTAAPVTENTGNTEGGPAIAAPAAIVIDLSSGSILYRKNIDQHMDPASLTKIMTVWMALTSADSDDVVTMSASAFDTYDHDHGVLWIEKGESMSVLSAAYASLLASANDTTAMLAEKTAGSNDAMVTAMNAKAAELSMSNTNFQNPFGLNSAENYSTARDLAILTRSALQNSTFKTIFGSSSYTIPATNMTGSRVIANDCELIGDGDQAYAYASGCKIGSTEEGGYSLSASAVNGNSELITVVMGEADATTAYADTVSLMDYAFASYQTVVVPAADIGTRTVAVQSGRHHIADVTFSAPGDFRILLSAGVDTSTLKTEIRVENEDSETPEDITAKVAFLLDGKEVGTIDLDRKIDVLYTPVIRTGVSLFKYDVDLLSLGVTALFGLWAFVRLIGRFLRPPE